MAWAAEAVEPMRHRMGLCQATCVPHSIVDVDAFAADGSAGPGISGISPAGHANLLAGEIRQLADCALFHRNNTAVTKAAHDEIWHADHALIAVMSQLRITA